MNDSTRQAMFSSATDDWATPQDVFDRLNKKYGPFDLDVCAVAGNAKCERYFSPQEDGLQQPWGGHILVLGGTPRCWMNPPYGRGIGDWVKKAYEESLKGLVVCCLLPSRTDTKWFQDYCLPYGRVEFIRGRLKFGGAKNSAPFPSVVVVFGLKEVS